MLMAFYESFGLKDLELHINSIGDFDSRKEYQKALQEHFRPRIDEFCDDCQSKIEIAYIGINNVEHHSLVRGRDFYTYNVDELMRSVDCFGTIITVAGGGRYKGLLEMLNSPAETAVGFALSIDRLLLALEAE